MSSSLLYNNQTTTTSAHHRRRLSSTPQLLHSHFPIIINISPFLLPPHPPTPTTPLYSYPLDGRVVNHQLISINSILSEYFTNNRSINQSAISNPLISNQWVLNDNLFIFIHDHQKRTKHNPHKLRTTFDRALSQRPTIPQTPFPFQYHHNPNTIPKDQTT